MSVLISTTVGALAMPPVIELHYQKAWMDVIAAPFSTEE